MKIGDLILEKCIGKGETGEIFLTSKVEKESINVGYIKSLQILLLFHLLYLY